VAHAVDHYHLARVLVAGSERYHEEDLVRATGLTVNSEVTADDLQNAANRLGNSGAFATVQYLFKSAIGTKGVEADFQVTDADRFLPAAFENFIWFSDGELQEAVHKLVPLYNGQLPASGGMSDEVETALAKILAAKGLPSDVNYMLAAEFGQLPSVYKFTIANANLRIKDIAVSGAAYMPPDLLTKSVAPLKNTAYLRSDVAKVLEKNLVPLYRERGFLKFAISEIRPRLESPGQVSVEVSVSEGDQYKLDTFTWSGNTLIASDELSKRISLKAGEPVNALQLDHDLAQAKKLYGKFGREGVAINPNPTFSSGGVAYKFEVTEGDQYHMGKVEIEGLDAEQVHKLMQSWKLGEGEPYDSTYVYQFLAHTVLKIPGHKWQWLTSEQVDDAQKTVNVRLQLKIE
jgi:outer membrane protein insertion porin family